MLSTLTLSVSKTSYVLFHPHVQLENTEDFGFQEGCVIKSNGIPLFIAYSFALTFH